MLQLVGTDRHGVGVVGQDVGRHQHRIGKQARVGRQPFGLLVFEGMTTFQQANRRAGHQQPTKLAHLGHVGLHKQHGMFGVESQRQQVDGRVERELRQQRGIANGGQSVQIGDEVVRFIGRLQVNVLADGAKIVAPMKSASRLNAREDAHDKGIE